MKFNNDIHTYLFPSIFTKNYRFYSKDEGRGGRTNTQVRGPKHTEVDQGSKEVVEAKPPVSCTA